MSVTFSAADWKDHPKFGRILYPLHSCEDYPCDECNAHMLNCANSNARELLAWLGLPATDELLGEVEASELAARCRRRLWNEDRNHDPGIEGYEDSTPGQCRSIQCGRRADYLRDRTAALLVVAETAGAGFVTWG